ncbi:MAG TPA: hypothetical protein VFR58_13890 [Flavisolibacter sp.]|nr:hypothetical protein [Flavisolibacter sp.]
MSKNLQHYIERQLVELEKQKDMNDLLNKGRFSFGADSRKWGHLPAWAELVKQKKIMIRLIWVEAFFAPLLIVAIAGDIWEKLETNWISAVAGWIFLSAFAGIFYVLSLYHTLFVQYRRTEREIRKLIYQDLLEKIAMEESSPNTLKEPA